MNMGLKVRSWSIGLLFLLGNLAFCAYGNFMDRRLVFGYPEFGDFDSKNGGSHYNLHDNLVFLGQSDTRPPANREQSPLEYLEDMDWNSKLSAFRERKLHEQQNLAEMLLNYGKNNAEYAELLRELYRKSGQYDPQSVADYYGDLYEKNELKKKSKHYGNMGLNMVGMKKRSGQSYPTIDEAGDAGLYLMNVPSMRSKAKRFPVTKRSSNYYPIPFTDEMPRQFKRSSHLNKGEKLMQTDPKVAEDLSSIFTRNSDHKEEKHDENDRTVTKPKRTEHATETSTSIGTAIQITTTQKPEVKENLTDVKGGEKEKPIQIKKKSIDWNDYFGVDKRKKPDNGDNEWLMERYHKAVALTAKRTSSENSEDNEKKINKTRSYSASTTEEKINDMDNKLKNIEYAIVDDALKASKAQETEYDTKEVQEMKDRIISQLAAAYSLEKMRRALNEYRESIKKERLAAKEGKNQNGKAEEKRLSVPRKSAGDMETVTADNNIKCSNGDENCLEQSYKTPEELLDGYNFGYCPKVQRACGEIASILGQYERMLENACTMHQMCLLCGDNTWFPPTRQCNVLFLNKADYLCNDDVECKEVARHSVRYLLELNRLLKSEPLEACELAC